MTDLTALTEITAPTTDDLVYVVDAPAGAKNPRKCSIANLIDSRTKTLTNTTIDADGTGNSITNIENADIKSGAGIDATKIADGSVTSTEFKYINTLSDNAQTQIDGKSPTAGNTSLTTTGALGTGSITSGFGSINIGTDTITSGAITAPSITGTASGLSSTLAIASGGTASTSASDARTALGVAIGSNVQAYNSATALTTNKLNDFAAPNAAVALGSQKITGLAAGVADTDAANKGQVDAAQAGLDAKDACRVATTANITLSGEQAIDGVTTTTDRVLVKNQSTGSQNGIYVSASGAWARSTDADANAEVTSGLYTFITEGTANGSTGFVLTTDDPITVGTTALTFSQFSGLAQLVGGTGITKTGNTINVDAIQTQVTSLGTLGTLTVDNLTIDANKIESINAGGAIELAPKTTGVVTVIGNTNDGAIKLNCTSNSHGQTIKSQPHSATATNTMLLPLGANSTLVSLVSTDTLTNKTLGTGTAVTLGSDATLDIYYRSSTGALARLAKGSAGEALKINAANNALEWGTAGGLGAELTTTLQAVGYSAANQSPATEGTSAVSFFVKTIDTNNQGVYVRVKKNGAYTDVQIA